MPARYVPLFWRLFVPNAAILGLACVVLMVEPANGRVPALLGGLLVMLLADLLLMRRAIGPLERLTELMRSVDPLHPGRRIAASGPASEVSVLTEAFNDMLDRLEDERRDNARRMLAEREQERRRIAAELHDQIGQDLTAVALIAARTASRHQGECAEEIEGIRKSVLASIDDLRGVARRLRPEALDDLGLVPALINMLERVQQDTGVRVTRDLQRDLPVLTANAELVLYRVAQESVTNAIRHAEPSLISVALSARADRVRLVVRDDGRGIDAARAELADGGLRTMRERAVLLGADLTVGAPDDGAQGTSVVLEFDPVTAR